MARKLRQDALMLEEEGLFILPPMARKLRLEYPGAIYHIMNRGDRREPIYLDEVDRRCFLQTLSEGCEKTAWQIHAYCLMGNHDELEVDSAAIRNQQLALLVETSERRTGGRTTTDVGRGQ